MIRAHAGRRHARPAPPRELGYHITNTLLWIVFVPVAAAVAIIVTGPILYELGV